MRETTSGIACHSSVKNMSNTRNTTAARARAKKTQSKATIVLITILFSLVLLAPQIAIANTGNGTDYQINISTWTHNAWGKFIAETCTSCSESDSTYGSNYWSVQLNTNYVSLTIPYGSGCPLTNGCPTTGWLQFFFLNKDSTAGYAVIEQSYIAYYHVYGICPNSAFTKDYASWSCTDFQYRLMSYKPPDAASLYSHGLNVSGTVSSTSDQTKVCDTYWNYCQTSPTESDYMGFNNNLWTTSEFNVFGYEDSSQAQFSGTVSLTVEDYMAHTSGLQCISGGTSGETTNLNLVSGSCTVNGTYTISFRETH